MKSKMSALMEAARPLIEQGYGRTLLSRSLGISESMATRLIRQLKVGYVAPKQEELFVPVVKKSGKKCKSRQYPDSGSILIIGDSHAKPGVSNERFTKLGKFIVEHQPSVVVQIGDWFDMPSLSSYDVGKKSFEGRRLIKDYEAGWDALERVNHEIDKYNKSAKVKYDPIKIAIEGNHENRLSKAVNSDPKLEGTISSDDFKFAEYGWEFYPFLEPAQVMGITFQHYFVSGSMDRAISSENTGRTILKKYHGSAFAGHSHKLDLAWEANGKGKLMVAGSIGCYFEHIEEWQSLQAQKHFWRGLVLLEDVEDGMVGEYRLVSLDTINKRY